MISVSELLHSCTANQSVAMHEVLHKQLYEQELESFISALSLR
jgi:hypothetical protein